MRDEMGDHNPKQQSKFEWRPGDVIILSPEESAAVTAEFEEWQAELARKTPAEEGQASSRRTAVADNGCGREKEKP